jgi:hypothetical protein
MVEPSSTARILVAQDQAPDRDADNVARPPAKQRPGQRRARREPVKAHVARQRDCHDQFRIARHLPAGLRRERDAGRTDPNPVPD